LFLGVVLCANVYANEPADADWDWNLTVERIYVGDFNAGEGRIYIRCTNCRTYIIDCGPQWGYLAYTSAMDAFARGKKISIRRSGTADSGKYWVYRLAYHN